MKKTKIIDKYNFNDLSKVIDNKGTTKAYKLAEDNNLPREWMTLEILKLENPRIYPKNNYNTIASLLASNNKLPKEYMTLEILKLPAYYYVNGDTIAHYLTKFTYNELPDQCMNKEILSLTNEDLRTPAHNLAVHGNLPKKFRTKEILGLKDKLNISVSDELNNYNRANPEFHKKIEKFLIKFLRI